MENHLASNLAKNANFQIHSAVREAQNVMVDSVIAKMSL
jgi:hypothetical protein